MKIHPTEGELFHTDGQREKQTGIHGEDKSRSTQLSKAPKNRKTNFISKRSCLQSAPFPVDRLRRFFSFSNFPEWRWGPPSLKLDGYMRLFFRA